MERWTPFLSVAGTARKVRSMNRARHSIAVFALVAFGGCATIAEAPAPQLAFFERLRSLCGSAYQGRVVSTDAADRNFAASRLVMHVRSCSADEIRIPFHVGDDRSRTWVVSRTDGGLRLKH